MPIEQSRDGLMYPSLKHPPGDPRPAEVSAAASPAHLDPMNENSPSRLHQMAAAMDLLECHRVLAKTGHNVVGEILHGGPPFTEWSHYPEDDILDPEWHTQYYYHAHPPKDRPFHEHGHFHLFLRSAGMPDGAAPLAGQELPADRGAILSHIVAISMDPFGQPIRLFTTNRWVTGDIWYAAPDVVRMLDFVVIDVVRPNLVVSRWLTAIVRLFRPQIEMLLLERDRRIDLWRSDNPDTDVFEDRRLEITSSIVISFDSHVSEALRRN